MDGMAPSVVAPGRGQGGPMGASLIVIIIVVVILAFVAWKSFHSIGAAEVGLVSKRFGFRKLSEDNPIAFRGEAGYQATLLMPGPALQALADVRREEVPVGAGAGGRDRRGDRAGRRAAARSAPRARSTSPSSPTSPTCTASSSRAARRACSGRCCPRARWCRSTRSAFLVITAQSRVRPAGVARPRRPVEGKHAVARRRSGSTPTSSGSW